MYDWGLIRRGCCGIFISERLRSYTFFFVFFLQTGDVESSIAAEPTSLFGDQLPNQEEQETCTVPSPFQEAEKDAVQEEAGGQVLRMLKDSIKNPPVPEDYIWVEQASLAQTMPCHDNIPSEETEEDQEESFASVLLSPSTAKAEELSEDIQSPLHADEDLTGGGSEPSSFLGKGDHSKSLHNLSTLYNLLTLNTTTRSKDGSGDLSDKNIYNIWSPEKLRSSYLETKHFTSACSATIDIRQDIVPIVSIISEGDFFYSVDIGIGRSFNVDWERCREREKMGCFDRTTLKLLYSLVV